MQDFLGRNLFWRNFWGGTFLEEFFGRIFLKGTFGRIFLFTLLKLFESGRKIFVCQHLDFFSIKGSKKISSVKFILI